MKSNTYQTKLAIEGGKPVRTDPFPSVNDISGRSFDEEEIDLVVETIRSGRLNYVGGTRVEKLEQAFADYYGVKYCTASSSGTAALHIAIGAIGTEPGDEIIVPPITDIGTVIGILYQNAIPIFADVDPQTMTLSPEDVAKKITKRTRAIITVHLLGNACDMDPIIQIAKDHNIHVIEDVAQAYLTRYRGQLVGTFGTFGCFSLQQSKHMTSGDGGLTITNDEKLGQLSKMFSDKGWIRPLYKDVMFLAPNYRMSELQAAVAIAQLNKLEQEVISRQRLAHELLEMLEDTPGITTPLIRPEVQHSYWQFAILLDRNVIKESVYKFGEALQAEGIPCLPGYTREPMYMYPIFQNKRFYGNSSCPYGCELYGRDLKYEKGLCPNAERVLEDVVIIPWNSRYNLNDAEDIGSAINKVAIKFSRRTI